MRMTRTLIFGLACSVSVLPATLTYAQSKTNPLANSTVNEGLDAYSKGDVKRAYDIWSYHAKNYPWGGSESEREHAQQAQTNLGALYYLGKGTYQSNFMAAYWHNESATFEHHAGQNNMGEMHEKGLGVFKDPYKALELYKKSAAQGDPNGIKNQKRLEAKLKDVPKPQAKFTWAPKTLKETAQVSVAYADHNGHPVITFQLSAENFDEKIAKAKIRFLDRSSVKDVKVNGTTYKTAIFLQQYFRKQRFATLKPFDIAETYRSQRSIDLIDCTNKSSQNWTYQILGGDEQTGKINNYGLLSPDQIKLTPQKPGTIGYAMVAAVCDGKYYYTPK